MNQGLKPLEAAIFSGAASYLSANKANLADDLAPLENAAADEVEALAAGVFKNVPVFGSIVDSAIAKDKPALVAAFAAGVDSGIDHLIAFCNSEAADLAK